MNEYRTKLGEDGRVIIPAACRRQLHLEPGEELIIRVENSEMHLFKLKHSLEKAQSLVKHYAKNRSLVKKLTDMREEDNSHD